MSYIQLTFTSRCWLAASDRQAFLFVIVVFLDIVLSRYDVDTNYQFCIFGLLAFFNH
jgi:hypothetical protein